jgi:hypothetical protein
LVHINCFTQSNIWIERGGAYLQNNEKYSFKPHTSRKFRNFITVIMLTNRKHYFHAQIRLSCYPVTTTILSTLVQCNALIGNAKKVDLRCFSIAVCKGWPSLEHGLIWCSYLMEVEKDKEGREGNQDFLRLYHGTLHFSIETASSKVSLRVQYINPPFGNSEFFYQYRE